jgi:peptidoglycan lytic transglycosylase G
MTTGKLANLVYKIFGIAILLLSFAGGWIVMDYKHYVATPLPIAEPGYRHVIAPGTSLKRFSADIHQAGILPHPFYFRWMARLAGDSQAIKAGEYLFAPGITPSQLLRQVVSGAVIQHAFTIVEGWTFAQLLEALRHDEVIAQTLDGLTPDQIMERLGYADQHAEGCFMPDTYHFPRGTTDAAFLQRAYQSMASRLDEEWTRRDPGLPYRTPYDALIMASIIEKETALPEERSEIAGVFVRRLERGMRLQTDPTVIYGLGERFDGNLRRQDLAADSPYNTYMHAGLPPTPIAMPGRASLHAALHPAAGDTLYFVSRGQRRREIG